jgi:hypothetical protein
MAKLESWTSLGSLAMGSLFVAMMISFCIFLIGPEGEGPNVEVDPGALLAQTISISGIPSLILAGFVAGLSFRSRNVFAGLILVATGSILIIGMMLVSMIVPDIDVQFRSRGLEYVPIIFLFSGICVLGLGIYLAKFAPLGRVRRVSDFEY